MNNLRIILFTLLILLFSFASRASHIVGIDLTYNHVAGNTYKISLIIYGDCGSGSAAFAALPLCTPEICLYNGNTYSDLITLNIEPPSTGVEVTPVCPAQLSNTQCSNISSTTPGIKKFVYSKNYTLPGTSSVWRFVFGGSLGTGYIAGRANSITNVLIPSSGSIIRLVDTLNNSVAPNSSPNLTAIATPFFCLNNPSNYNPGAVDPDGDLLSFQLIAAREPGTSPSCSINNASSYIFPYSGVSPLQASSFAFDPSNGQLSFTPDALQRSLVVYNIRQTRGGVFVGSCQREMTFVVLTCSVTAPSATITSASAGTVVDSVHHKICQNTGDFSLTFNPTSVDGSNVWVTATGLPAGSSISTVGAGTPTPITTFSWTSTGITPGDYIIYLTFTDDHCPLVGTQTIAYTITILPSPTVSVTTVADASCTSRAAISVVPSGSGGPYRVVIYRGAGDTVSVRTGVNTTYVDSIGPGDYFMDIMNTNGCKSTVSFSVAYPPPFPAAGTAISPSYCGLNDGKIIISLLTPGNVDTIKYSLNGLIQPSIVSTVSSAGTITLSGLGEGMYTDITATFRYCRSVVLGPYLLLNPPMPTPTATFVNPSSCGRTDGRIIIKNLRPTYVDTVRYNKDGVPQPYVVLTVAADSSVVLNGLGAGVYSNIVVSYGTCVAPAIGPYTLVDPPVPPITGSFTNPSYCGHNDGTITINNLVAGDIDTVKFYRDGILQPSVVFAVPSSGTVVLTGLYAGEYTNITATFRYCVTNALAFTLVNPPVPNITATFVNPSYCGHNDGKIILSNLHPGDVDTVRYFKDGILQPLYSAVVSAAGTVTLSGLYDGVYSGIYAYYGPCNTNTVGPFTLVNPPLLVPSATFTSTTFCGSTDGKIVISNLYPGDVDTLHYTLNGVVQPVRSLLVSAAGTVTLTGLGAGLYTDIYATYGPCTTISMGPITLVDPPFKIGGASFSHPTKCGFCDGKITFYGLHPGQIDSIHYTLDGVPQAPVAVLVPADSTISLTGLCEGNYSNLYVNFNSNCISGIYGPYLLDAPPIIPGFNYTLTKNCVGDTLICVNTSWPASDLTYVWDFGDGTTSSLTNPVHIYTTPGVYTVQLNITNTRCVDSTSISITLDNLVNSIFTTNPDSFACKGNPVIFTNASLGYSMSYVWNFGDGSTDTSKNTTHTYTSVGVQTVSLVAYNTVPCYDTAYKVLEVDSISSVGFEVTDTAICVGGFVTFSGAFSPNGSLGMVWHFGDGDSIANANPVIHGYGVEGQYTITLNAYYRACPDTAISRSINVYASPQVNLGNDTTVCTGNSIIVLADLINSPTSTNMTWLWNTGQKVPSISVAEPGTYILTVSRAGCEASDEVVVTNDCQVIIPNAFTPNNDGINDYFVPRDLLSKGLVSFSMSVYNRWGNEMFTTTNTQGRGWDGRYNDVMQPEGVYVYVIDAVFKDGKKEHYQGNFTLLK